MYSYSLRTYSLLTVATTNRRLNQVHQIIVIVITLGRALCVRKETVSQLSTLKKNVTKQEKDLKDVSTSTSRTTISTTISIRT